MPCITIDGCLGAGRVSWRKKPHVTGVASATVTTGQMLGGSVGTSLLNTIFASAVASYLTANFASARSPDMTRADPGPHQAASRG